MITVNPPKLNNLIPRMLELTSRNTPWHRRNWRAGTLELVQEVLDEAKLPGTSKEALKELQLHMTKALHNDPAILIFKQKLISCTKQINDTCNESGHTYQLALHLANEIKEKYLLNWAQVFATPARAGELDVEGTAKRIVSHILYSGMTEESLYTFIQKRNSATQEVTIQDVLKEIDERLKRPCQKFRFGVPVTREPSFIHNEQIPDGWLTARSLKQWKHKYASHAPKIRHSGGFILEIEACDINSAVFIAQQKLAHLSLKFLLGSLNRFTILEIMWSQEKHCEFPTKRAAIPLKLQAFNKVDMLHQLSLERDTQNILAIITPLHTRDAHVSIISGWAAIESLLVESTENDRIGAKRMAFIVAASYFRSELNWLAHSYLKVNERNCPIAQKIADTKTSLGRAEIMEKFIQNKESFPNLPARDRLSVEKIRAALHNPKKSFDNVTEILELEFLRMYRKRNLIVHSGQTVEFGIDSLANNIIPVLIAGIDQILIANLQRGMTPSELSAQIEFRSLHLGMDPEFTLANLLDASN